MAEIQLTLPGEIVKKSNELIQTKVLISTTIGSRILASLIACIRSDDKELKDLYSIPVKNFLVDESGKGYANVKKICKDLFQSAVEIEYTTEDGNDFELTHMPFFTIAKYKKGVISAEFNPKLRYHLTELQEKFTKYNLIEYLTLPSIYSQRLFELLMSWHNVKEGQILLPLSEPQPDMPKQPLHAILNTPESLQVDFAQFRRRVLEKAHQDIHKNTSLRFEWEPVKRGRAVVAVRFVFAGKKRALLQEEKAKEARRAQSAENNRNAYAAVECLKAKGGRCEKQDNKPEICSVCFDRKETIL